MLRLLLTLALLFAGSLTAQAPLHHGGVPLAVAGVTHTLERDDGSVLELFVADAGPHSFTTRWRDAQGVWHEHTTQVPGNNPNTNTILQSLKKHEEIVKAMQAIHPPVPQPGGGVFQGTWHILPRESHLAEALPLAA
jgi:hypothetical protein